MDDDEPSASSPPLQDQSAEIGNVQNQLSSTNRSLNAAKSEREPIEQTLATQAAQLSALQTQLSSAKAAYETETKLLSTLKDRMGAQTSEIQKAREELIRAESDLSAVRVEKTEIEGAFMRDKEDVRALQRKMAETGTDVASLKLEIEKAKKEAKQQKGLLAIAKKQLSTKEIEKAKAQKELEEAESEVKGATVEREAAEALLESSVPAMLQNGHDAGTPIIKSPEGEALAAAINEPLPASLPVSPDPSSPAGSSLKSNNPFDRLARSSSSSTPRSQSPFLPFADAATISTPIAAPTEAEAASADPFGFSQAFAEEPATITTTGKDLEPAATEAGTITPRADNAGLPLPSDSTEEHPLSPASASGSDFFSTPPSTAAGLSQSPAAHNHNRLSEVPSVDSQFPPLDNIPGSFPATEEHHEATTDFGAPLKEIEAEESDSDSDSDEEPLSNVKHKLQSSTDTTPAKSLNGISIPPSTFDDAFGGGPEPSTLQTPKASTAPNDANYPSLTSEPSSMDAFGAPLGKGTNPFPMPSTFAEPAPAVAGVNAFDEALAKIPATGEASPAANFSFDSAFEDNFDFASATTSAPSFPPPPSTANGNGNVAHSSPLARKPSGFEGTRGAPIKNGASSEPKKSLSFDDAFSADSSTPVQTGQQVPALPPRKESMAPSVAISFDDAFGGVESSQALKLDSGFGSASSRASAATSPISQGQPGSILKPTSGPQSPPLSPKGGPSSPRISSIRSSTPPRSMSPPPRLGSPGPRPSTSSSSKDGHEKPKEHPTRSSRLSVSIL